MLKKNIIAALALCLGCQAADAEVWSLDSCISYAVAHNVSMRQQQLRIEQGHQAVTEAYDAFLPQADASAGQSWNFGRGLTAENTYANRNTSNTQWNVGLNLPLFQGLAEYRRAEVAKLSLQQCLYEREATRDNLTLNIISQYLQVLYAEEVIRSAESQAAYSRFEVERQRELVETGKVAGATLYDMEAVAAQDELQIVTARNDWRTALVNLSNLLQAPAGLLTGVEPLGDEPALEGSALRLWDEVAPGNSGLQSGRQAVLVADRNISVAKAGYIPTLSFNAGLGSSYYNLAGMDNEGFGAQMRHNFSKYLGFSLRIPLFDAFSTRNNVRRARLQRTEAQLALEQREEDLRRDILLAWTQADGARERYETARTTLDKTRLSFEATAERFNLGRATQADYEQSKNNLFRTEVAMIQARYEYLIRTRILRFYRDSARH